VGIENLKKTMIVKFKKGGFPVGGLPCLFVVFYPGLMVIDGGIGEGQSSGMVLDGYAQPLDIVGTSDGVSGQ